MGPTKSTRALKKVGLLRQSVRSLRKYANNEAAQLLSRFITSRQRFDVVVFSGLKRSGNHVAINWHLQQAKGPCCFYNHVRPHQYPTERRRREFYLHDLSEVPRMVFSYEDRDDDDIFRGPLKDFLDRHRASIRATIYVPVVRDYRNLMASRLKKWPDDMSSVEKSTAIVAQWKTFARDIVEQREHKHTFDVVPIYYNAFISNPQYRERIAQGLKIRHGDKGLDKVPLYGHGSSFSGTGGLDTDNIFDRWREFEDHPAFKRLLSDPEWESLNAQLEDVISIR